MSWIIKFFKSFQWFSVIATGVEAAEAEAKRRKLIKSESEVTE